MKAWRPLPESSSQLPSQTFSTRTIWPQTDAQSQLAGPEAPEAVALTEPLKVLDAELFGVRGGSHEAGTPEEDYREPGLAARPKPPYSGGDHSHYRRRASFAFDVIAGVTLLSGLVALAVLTGRLHVRQFLSHVHQAAASLTLSAALGFIIAIAMIGVIVGCVLYRVRTRYRRITPTPHGAASREALWSTGRRASRVQDRAPSGVGS